MLLLRTRSFAAQEAFAAGPMRLFTRRTEVPPSTKAILNDG
jgi:hypothetical protein